VITDLCLMVLAVGVIFLSIKKYLDYKKSPTGASTGA